MNRRDVLKTSALFLGYAVSTAALSELFVSCAGSKHLHWTPVFLKPDQAHTIAEMTERILPKTKTPGAKDLHIDKFIDKMLKDLLSPEDQADFLRGLEAFESACQHQHGKRFVDCTTAQQDELLRKMDRESAKLPPSVWGIRLAAPAPTPFFRRVKELTLLGYFTSEQVERNVLNYDPLPGRYIACLPLAEVGGKIWNE